MVGRAGVRVAAMAMVGCAVVDAAVMEARAVVGPKVFTGIQYILSVHQCSVSRGLSQPHSYK
jgi:hypothetical protein